MRFYLASSSPRRKELLERLGISFDVFSVDVDESLKGNNGKREAIRLSKKKVICARDLLVDFDSVEDDLLILSADTLVWKGHKIFGKPVDIDDAFYMLKILSGKWHFVTTAYSVFYLKKDGVKSRIYSGSSTTRVKFRKMPDSDINRYLDCGEWEGVAGAYRIQGKGENYIEKIDGSFSNVVGLPICKLDKLLKRLI